MNKYNCNTTAVHAARVARYARTMFDLGVQGGPQSTTRLAIALIAQENARQLYAKCIEWRLNDGR